jgi:hypothetical protein
MNVNLTPDQKAFVRDAIASGRLHGEEDVIREALALWGGGSAPVPRSWPLLIRRKPRSRAARAALLQQSVRDLAGEVKQCGRARLAAEQSPKTWGDVRSFVRPVWSIVCRESEFRRTLNSRHE